MKKITLLFIVAILSCFLFSSASANDLASFFFKQYDCTKGKPNLYTDTFDAVPREAVLRVENGSGEKLKIRVSSAEIRLIRSRFQLLHLLQPIFPTSTRS
ncbi:MAG: hypothetical protein D3904_02825 [Candidatus Electrothrix sp. EH2]|nr:hypothetical protein [Candidatus Electrothrix sp. EH2]